MSVILVAVLLLPVAAWARPAPDSFADLAAKLLPAVVNISTTQARKGDNGGPDAPQARPGSPFEEYFKDFFNHHNPESEPQALPHQATSLGSGFIIDPSGLIVTNNHVVANADAITVTLQDNTSFKAELVGRDSVIDVALLKIKAPKALPFVKFGDSDKIRIGDWVLVIGNPFGLGGTVTAGILSARSRDIDAGPYDDFLQTDAAINRGNSGGPMFNMDGEVVGIATAIYSPSGGSIGIGFALPSNMARPVIDQIRQYGHARRSWLGINIQSVTDEIAESLGLDKPRGALVASVKEGGPAQVAGIEPGDVVLEFDGKPITDMHRLPLIVAETPIGKTVKVTLWRKRKELVRDVTVGELKEETQASLTPSQAKPPSGAVAALGLSIADLSPKLRERFALAENAAGVVVVGVEAKSPAADKGMRPGDVIVEVAQEDVKSASQVNDLVAAAKKSGRKTVLLLVDRQGDLRFVALRLD